LVNLTGFGVLVAVAYIAGWYKSQPWRGPKPANFKPQPAVPARERSEGARVA